MSLKQKTRAESRPKVSTCSDAALCKRCIEDQKFLKTRQRPKAIAAEATTIRVVDLFAGCGGMSIGLREAARRLHISTQISLAIDSDPAVLAIFKSNMRTATIRHADVSELFNGNLGAQPTPIERSVVTAVSALDILMGGPPCQGHSDLNNHTRRQDPKNELYVRMGRAAEVLRPKCVVIENVATVQWDRSNVVQQTKPQAAGSGRLFCWVCEVAVERVSDTTGFASRTTRQTLDREIP